MLSKFIAAGDKLELQAVSRSLGEQNEELYEPTNNAEIAFAFREAGEVSGT